MANDAACGCADRTGSRLQAARTAMLHTQRKTSSDVTFCGKNITLLTEQAMKESIAQIAVVPDLPSKVQPRSVCPTQPSF